jgi:3D-(3,5/4)-trihydroxycyclohexane-1,2-dione acylhydrolase (decyclizing)
MMNSEIATSIMLGLKLTIVLLDNGGYGCIDRLQRSTGSESFNNLLATARHVAMPEIDFAAHAASLGASARKVSSLEALEAAVKRARRAKQTSVIVIDTDPANGDGAGIGGHWWDVAIAETSETAGVREARKIYDSARKAQKLT